MKFPTYIVVEGPDCSGKSTLVNALAEKLRSLGSSVYQSREPYSNTKLGMEGKSKDIVTEMMRLDRLHITGGYMMCVGHYDFIISDRNYNSEAACQGETKAEILDILDLNRQWFVTPDLTVFLEVNKSEAAAICYARGEAFSPPEFDRLVRHYHFIQGQTTTPKVVIGPAWSVDERVSVVLDLLGIEV